MSSRSPVKADSIPTQDPSLAPWNISSVSAHRLMELPPASTSVAMSVRWPFPTVDVPDHHHYTLGSVILAVGITGMVGNFLVMYAFCRSRSLRTPANMFIINLALTDFLMCVTQTPIFFINSMHNRWIFGEKACELYAFCGALFGMTSMITLLVIAVDRYFVITRPLASMGVMSRRRALYVMAAAWFYSMFWSLPPFFGWSAYVPEGLMTSCSWDYMTFTPSVRSYTMLLFIFVFFIPLFIIIYCYICIFIAVRSATRAVCKINEGTRDSVKSMHKMRTEWKTAKIALIVILLYVISWAPYSCVALTAFAGYADMLTPYMNSVPAAIAKASAIHNPIIYAITHPKYRLAISRYIPFMGVLLCVPTRDRYSSSSFMSSTRRSTLTSTTSDPGKTGKPRQSSLSDSESAFTDTEAQHSSRPASRQVSSDVTQLHPTFSQRSKGHCSLKVKGRDSGAFEKAASQSPSDPAVGRLQHVTTLTEPEDISMSEIVGLTNILPATLDDVREEKSSQGVSGRESSTCLTDLIPAIVLASTSSPSSISLLQRQGSRGNPANNSSKGAGLAVREPVDVMQLDNV
ncbi:melanopsin-A [Salmo trutta]|uniref:melanopsin-A n=1 Tax=Salmo trutta TaxID=8032 RepID=UPI001130B18B|nr:melanopsin-A-like [Salmo trutta]XP_029560373.1 melanopsin-A-like [Salmo trutta]